MEGKKNEDTDLAQKKCDVTAHNLISAVRPRSSLSRKFLLNLECIYRKYESRILLDLLSKLGICSSYQETLSYESSAVTQQSPDIKEEGLLQFVFDNADIDVLAIDCHYTFHCMGGIQK